MKRANVFLSFFYRYSCVIFLCLLSACATGPTGEKPVSPPIGSRTGQEAGERASEALDEKGRQESGRYKIAILLPLTGSEAETGQALLSAASVALFDSYDPSISLIPFDTAAEGGASATEKALTAGVDLILGPLLSHNLIASTQLLREARSEGREDLPLVIGFSNDETARGEGRYVMGFSPRGEIERIISFAAHLRAQQMSSKNEIDDPSGAFFEGVSSKFAGLIPVGRYGDLILDAFGESVRKNGGTLVGFERFDPIPDAFDAPVRKLADYDRRRKDYTDEVSFLRSLGDDITLDILSGLRGREVLEGPGFDIILLAEGGERLKGLAPLLPFYEIDPKEIQILGTGLWNDTSLLREPPLQGAIFAAPDPEQPSLLLDRLEKLTGRPPPRIATLAYDAVSLAAYLVAESKLIPSSTHRLFTRQNLERKEGFTGVDGAFRFLANGLTERQLAVLEIDRGGFKVLEAAPEGFSDF